MRINFSELIKEKIEINHMGSARTQKINIAYGVDKVFLFGAGVSMTSILLHNPDIDIHFYIVTDSLDQNFIIHATALAQQYHVAITILQFNDKIFQHLPKTKAWSLAMYYRYFAFEYLSGSLDKVLYLDADVICKGTLLPLAEIALDRQYAAVVSDVDEVRLASGKRLGIPALSERYFNSGVVLANLRLWREESLFDKAMALLEEKGKSFLYFDQDALNVLYDGNIILLPRKYNSIYGIDQQLKVTDKNEYRQSINDEMVLIHYVGITKPWHTWAVYPAADSFIIAYKHSPWAVEPLLNANSAKLYKRKSRHERVQGKPVMSIISHIMYIKNKLFK